MRCMAKLVSTGVDMAGGKATGSIYRVPSTVVATSVSINDKVESFWAIGCGSLHACEVLESYGYESGWSLPNSLYAIYCAKRAAELSPDVDKKCDIRIVTETGIVESDARLLKILEETYEAEWSKKKEPGAYPLISEAVAEIGTNGGC